MPAAPSSSARPRVVVFGLGGTIAMSTAGTGGVAPTLSVEQLLADVPGLTETDVHLEVVNFRNRPGASLTFDDLIGLAAHVCTQFDDGAIGVVIIQGTDTIEETAYLFDLLHPGPQPIVVTGAMRNPTLAGADGPANLLGAIRVAASTQARHLGSLVVMADEIHAAARVRKTHSTSVATFASPTGGPLGYLVEGTPRILNQPGPRHTIVGPLPTRRPRVGLYTATLGDDGAILKDAADRLEGLVIAAFGVGHVPATWTPILGEVASRIPVVLASRTGAGAVLSHTYGFPGSERDLIERGLIPAGLLDAYKARILLHLTLAAGASTEQVIAAFRAAGRIGGAAGWPWPAAAGTAATVHKE